MSDCMRPMVIARVRNDQVVNFFEDSLGHGDMFEDMYYFRLRENKKFVNLDALTP